MQFYHPEVLYALALLIIPILVHLFQLRRFKKEYFTNVKFLKKISLQTRKSSRIKKWLILLTRLLALAFIILAFAQPYLPSGISSSTPTETVIYLDNSYSMQAFGKKGRLLERSIQEILESEIITKNSSLFTNSEEFRDFKKEDLQNITYTGAQLDLRSIILKASTFLSKDTAVNKKLLIISDLQKRKFQKLDTSSSSFDIFIYKQTSERKDNLKIDTAYLTQEAIDSKTLRVKVSNSGKTVQTTPVSVYNEEQLIGKSSTTLEPNTTTVLNFPITASEIKKGKILIEDNSLKFDNTLYFSINPVDPIKIISINQENATFLDRIYTTPEFEFTSMTASAINYTSFNSANVILINEIQEISSVLNTTLLKLSSENRTIILIPSTTNVDNSFKSLAKNLGFSGMDSISTKEKFVTNIKFQHPLYKDVFEKQVKNFEYPKVQKSFTLKPSTFSILDFEDKSPFLLQYKNTYLFTGALNRNNSNFLQSPLVVPTFYKMAVSNMNTPLLYYYVASENKMSFPISVKNDEIVRISSEEFSFIPQQRKFEERVEIITDELPDFSGNFRLSEDTANDYWFSYNINRTESDLDFMELSDFKNIHNVDDLGEFFNSDGYQTKSNNFWKWFVTFAMLFLLIETLLIKYFK